MKRLAGAFAQFTFLIPFALLVTLFTLGPVLTPAGAAAAQEYRIQRGDLLRIEVLEDSTLNRTVLVSPAGGITVPLVGTIQAAGHTVDQIRAQLANALAPQFATKPTVYVALEGLAPKTARTQSTPRTVSVYLMGEFAGPGKLEVAPGSTVLQVFAQAKGFTRFAATKRIQLRRTGPDGKPHIYRLDYPAIVDGSSPNGRVTVKDGDVFVVPQRHLFE